MFDFNPLEALAGFVALIVIVIVLANADTIFAPTPGDTVLGTPTQTARTEPASCRDYAGTATTTIGDTGTRVRTVQCLLVARRYSVGPDGIDGIFGNDTLTAVKAFQRDTQAACGRLGLIADGVVGPKTWSALRAGNGCPAG